MKRPFSALSVPLALALLCAILVSLGWVTRSTWLPAVRSQFESFSKAPSALEGDTEHAAHEDHAGHDEATSLELSRQARGNLGLTSEFVRPIELSTFRKTVSVPALIAERPGQTRTIVSTPMTGVVTKVAAFQGAAIEPGAILFSIRLTHEDLVQSQTEFVKTLGELDVENREVARLESVAQSGAVAGKTLLERQYSREKLEALLKAQKEALRLHGLSERQVEQIIKDRRLLSELRIVAPGGSQGRSDELQLSEKFPSGAVAAFDGEISSSPEGGAPSTPNVAGPLIVEEILVQRGQSIEQGAQLCSLADYSRLYIEGRAFEQDGAVINAALAKSWTIQAVFPDGATLGDLPLAYVASEVDSESRTLKFYVDLPNKILRDSRSADGQRFVSWKFRPGQRLQLRVPVEEWPDQIVVPVDAVAQEGAESYVFQQNGQHFDRVGVRVLYRDQTSAVIANDGSLFPGTVVALRSAHQMQMALKNKAGGAIDPHAGHTH